MVTTYHLRADNLWNIWELLVLEHFLNVFPVLQKACRAFERFRFLVIFLQLGDLQSYTSDISVKTFKSYFVLDKVPELAQLGKNSCSAYEDLAERKKLTWLARQKIGYSGQQGLQAVQDFDIYGTKGFFLLCILLRVLRQGISSSISLALTIIDLKVVMREFFGPADLP